MTAPRYYEALRDAACLACGRPCEGYLDEDHYDLRCHVRPPTDHERACDVLIARHIDAGAEETGP